MILNMCSLAGLKGFPDNSFDSIVTDPPYELGFMGKAWDASGIANNVDLWRECLRVLKPGGHTLAFGGSRTYHRMTCAIEDSGFEIRDQIMWIYGSGFPKSHNLHGEYEGWGTALKPAHEPICVARKPFNGTVIDNVMKFGTGALNIDISRIELNGDYKSKANGRPSQTGLHDNYVVEKANIADTIGRWPANVIHDGSEEVLAAFPNAKGQSGKISGEEPSAKTDGIYNSFKGRSVSTPRIETAKSSARFFYCAKASKADREDGNIHPTVKPTDLMRYLLKLVTPLGGTVLDPFAGSGSTGKAAVLEGFNFIGFELDPEYANIATARINASKRP